jgi:hypothetical protein
MSRTKNINAELAHYPTLHFEPVGHRYTLRPDMIELPSVTQVLKETRMVDYSMIPQDVLEAASKRGTAVHQALHYLDDGDLDDATLDPAIHGYVMAYMAFKRDAGFEPMLVEWRSWNRAYRYAGTLDRTGTIRRKDGGLDRVVLDFKTGEVLPGHALQLTAYAGMCDQPRAYRRIALKLSADGSYRAHEAGEGWGHDFRTDFDLFIAALNVHWWQRTEGRIQQLEVVA